MLRECYNNRTEWLDARNKPMHGIGASEAALICGIKGAFGNLDELYDLKKGIGKPKKLTNVRIENGIKAEPLIRQLFAIDHEGIYKVEYHGYDILRSDKNPFMTATLDGELTDLANGEKGVWECKNVEITRKTELEEWSGGIPEKYLVQQIHQLEVTEWDFNLLVAKLCITDWEKSEGGDIIQRLPYKRYEYRYSYIRRDDEDYQKNAAFVVSEEAAFWEDLINGRRPQTRLF